MVLAAGFILCLEPAWADRLGDAIAATPRGSLAGHIDGRAATGFMGIHGAPSVDLALAFLWTVWVGWVFSTVGAFGGILAGVGHLSIFGLGDYAAEFDETSPVLDKLITDSIRTSNQWLVGLSAAVASFNYYRMGRLVMPLALFLGLGSVLGSTLVPWLTAGEVSLRNYLGTFGLFVLLMGAYLFYETTSRGQARKRNAREAALAFEASIKARRPASKAEAGDQGVRIEAIGPKNVTFTFFGVAFSFNPIVPVLGGFAVAALASFLGVGGGFLLVPFLIGIAGLPMYLVAGTASLAVLIGMVTSIFSFMVIKGTPVFWPLVGVEMMGVFVGSLIGPRLSRYIPDVWLQRLFVALVLYVGIRFFTKGFLGTSLVPPF